MTFKSTNKIAEFIFSPDDIRLKENSLSLGDSYKGIAIVTLEVENNNIRELELSNIDIYPYQNEILTKCFVTTAKDDIKGMVGYLKSGEKTDIKIGNFYY